MLFLSLGCPSDKLLTDAPACSFTPEARRVIVPNESQRKYGSKVVFIDM